MNVRTITAAALAVAACAAAAVAETRYVERAKVEVKDGKSIAGKVLATLKRGDAVNVTRRDADGWLQVAVPAGNGFVFEKALALSRPSVGGGGETLSAITGRSDNAEVSAAAAAKGLTPQTLAIARNRGYDPDLLERLTKTRHDITEAEFEQFRAAIRP
jgi:uncharacterized protein YgiM (DUF1202 family)